MARSFSHGAVLLCALCAACNSTIDVSVSRGSLSFHFSDAGCAVSFSGSTGSAGSGPSAIDLTCPVNLRSPKGGPTLHISTPLITTAGRDLPLQN